MEKNEINSIQQILVNKGLNYNDAKHLINKNPILLNYSLSEINNKINVILNNKEPYGVIFCDNDDLYWCTKQDGGFNSLFETKNNIDYIVQMIIGYIEKKKINEYLDFSSEETLEKKMMLYRDISGDSPGYKVK